MNCKDALAILTSVSAALMVGAMIAHRMGADKAERGVRIFGYLFVIFLTEYIFLPCGL